MVVFYFSIRAEEKKQTVREFSDNLKKQILSTDQKKVIGIEVTTINF
jgi:hypothetical protein